MIFEKKNLIERIKEANKKGYITTRYVEIDNKSYHDFFKEEIEQGYEVLKVEYPSNDRNNKEIRCPLIYFKFNKILKKEMEDQLLKLKILKI